MEIPTHLRFTSDHEWIRPEGDEGTCGITEFAQDQLGDVVFVELPDVGRTLAKGEAFGVIESVKAVYDLFTPVSGEVLERNESLLDHPEKVNESPYDEGWMIRVRLTKPEELDALLDSTAYQGLLAEA
ncbi:MAG TPA: glycine cleavage system protein GcvH [Tepidiformaceae bacterium]|nr:glycine cleavage system protein GcvH [Tepidiformaceae bacterium]